MTSTSKTWIVELLILYKNSTQTTRLASREFNMSFHAGQPFIDAHGKWTFCSLRYAAFADTVQHTLADSCLTAVAGLRSKLIDNSLDCHSDNINAFYTTCTTATSLPHIHSLHYTNKQRDRTSMTTEAKASGWLQSAITKTDVLFVVECNRCHIFHHRV